MTDRMLVALGTALLVAGSAVAQGPQVAPPPLSSQVLVPAPYAAPPAEEPGLLDTAWGGGPDGQLWLSAEYLLGWFSGDRLPPLVTTSPPGTPRISAGTLSGPNTILFGGNVVNDDYRSGFRVGAGYWFTPERTFGVEAGFMMLESQATGFAATSDGTQILARPFFDVTNIRNDSALIAFPGSSAGSVAAGSRSGSLVMFNLDLTENVADCGWFRLDSMVGYRFFTYGEGVRVRQTITTPSAPGAVFTSEDDFGTDNEFHGADFGLRGHFCWETVSLTLLSKVAVGGVNRDVKIVGAQTVTSPGNPTVAREGGLLALSSNIGNVRSSDWTLLPELGATLGWQAAPNIRVTLGYSVMWLDRIARAADQIDFGINPGLFPTAANTGSFPGRPAFLGIRNDVWFQTVNVGLELTY